MDIDGMLCNDCDVALVEEEGEADEFGYEFGYCPQCGKEYVLPCSLHEDALWRRRTKIYSSLSGKSKSKVAIMRIEITLHDEAEIPVDISSDLVRSLVRAFPYIGRLDAAFFSPELAKAFGYQVPQDDHFDVVFGRGTQGDVVSIMYDPTGEPIVPDNEEV